MPAGGVELEVAVDERRCQRWARAPRQRADPRDQLGEVERLGEVVVGADAETLDAILERPGRGQHQHPARAAVGDQRPADLVAVDAGKVAVEHDHVIVGERDAPERLAAVEREVDGHALAAQHGRHGLGEPRMILDHQHPHRSLLRADHLLLLGRAGRDRGPRRRLPAQDARSRITAT